MTTSVEPRSNRFWSTAILSVILLLVSLFYALVYYPLKRAEVALRKFEDLGFDIDFRELDDNSIRDLLLQAYGQSSGMNVEGLRLDQKASYRFREVDLGYCHSLPFLTSLQIDERPITSQGIRHLAGLNLQSLALSCPQDSLVKEHSQAQTIDLAPLATLKKIETLVLVGLPVHDEDLKRLAGLSDLDMLHIDDSPVTSKGIAHLSSLTKMRRLSFCRTNIDDDVIRSITPFKSLYYLELDQTQVTGIGLEKLTSCKFLSLQHNTLSDAGLKSISHMPNVLQLNLSHSRVTTHGLEQLSAMPKLLELKLNGPEFNDEHLHAIAKFEKLHSLRLSGSKVTAAGIKLLEGSIKIGRIELDTGLAQQPGVMGSLLRIHDLKMLTVKGGHQFDQDAIERQFKDRIMVDTSELKKPPEPVGL